MPKRVSQVRPRGTKLNRLLAWAARAALGTACGYAYAGMTLSEATSPWSWPEWFTRVRPGPIVTSLPSMTPRDTLLRSASAELGPGPVKTFARAEVESLVSTTAVQPTDLPNADANHVFDTSVESSDDYNRSTKPAVDQTAQPTSAPVDRDSSGATGDPLRILVNPLLMMIAPEQDPLVARARAAEAKAYESNAPADFRAAGALLESASGAHPDDLSLHRSLGYLYLKKLNDPKRAYPHLEAVYSATPASPGWGDMLAQAAGKTGRTDRQIQVLRELAAAKPADPWTQLSLAKALAADDRNTEAKQAYQQAVRLAPDDEWINLDYAEFLKSTGRLTEARAVTERVTVAHPNSAAARAMIGDLYRSDQDFGRARAEYAAALALDPAYHGAQSGMRDIDRAREPKVESVLFHFSDTDNFDQTGLFNTLSFSLTDRLYGSVSFNPRWFEDKDSTFGQITRYEEEVALEYRFNSQWSARGSATAFQTEDADDQYGLSLSTTWKPTQSSYVYGFHRLNDPVNDSITTVARAFTQDVYGIGLGFQIAPRLSTSAIGTYSRYSDDNERRFANVELAYLLWKKPQLYARLQYELIDYTDNRSTYSSPGWYQTIRPMIDVEPKITDWLSFRIRLEVPYILSEAAWGTGVTAGPVIKIGDRFTLNAAYLQYDIPGDFTNYSGNGFKLECSYRY